MLVTSSPSLVFWYEFASTYSYPAAARMEALAAAAGVTVVWRPFLLGPIFAAQGWTDSPFNLYPAKGRYMWRDLERICAGLGLPLRRPAIFPQNGLLAARVATLAATEGAAAEGAAAEGAAAEGAARGGWCPGFTRAVYRANFAEGRDISDPETVGAILEALGQPATAVLERAQAQPNKDRLRAATEEAIRRGIFGAPSFTVGDELFWGNDRLEQALDWAKQV